MLEFKPVEAIELGACLIQGMWQGHLLLSYKNCIQKVAPCPGLFKTESQAIQAASKLHAVILEQQGPFEFSGYVFSVAQRRWQDGFRGYILLIGTPDDPHMFRPPLDLLCKNYQSRRDDALCEAYAEAVRLIQAGIVVRKYNGGACASR